MAWRRRFVLAIAAAAAAAAVASVAAPLPAADQARWNRWALNCQGCHRPDASGTPGGAPAMKGVVARFLTVDGGREYLTRVPGVATAPISDADLADLLNFVLRHFDSADLPAGFTPYTAQEIAAGRRAPLRTNAAQTRERLVSRIRSKNQ